MRYKFSFTKTISLKKICLVLTIPVMLFTMIVAPAGVIGIGPQRASAADPRGDWWTQYTRTRDKAMSDCRAFAFSGLTNYSQCLGTNYVSSGSLGPHSRYFQWEIVWGKYTCYTEMHIGNNYHIFYNQYYYCANIYRS